MQQQVHVADRASIADASELMARFGEHAVSEAALRAARSREVGNFVHFCHWRQIERLIGLLSDRTVTGSVH